MPRILVIAEPADAGAGALAALLHHRRRVQVTVVGPSVFTGTRVVHQPSSGPPGPGPDSPEVSNTNPLGGEYGAILCRVPTPAAGSFARTADAEYAAAEVHALALSWLWERRAAVVNPPRPEALWGATPDVLTTAGAAGRAGLSVPAVLLASDGAGPGPARRAGLARHRWDGRMVPGGPDLPAAVGIPPLPEPAAWFEPLLPGRVTAFVAGNAVVGPPGLTGGLLRLAAELGLRWAEVSLGRSADGTGRDVVAHVSPMPSLAAAGHLEAAAHFLESLAAEHRAREVPR